MKRTIILLAIAMPLAISAVNVQAASTGIVNTDYSTIADWTRSANNVWPGMKDGKTYWYKLDENAGL